MRKPALVIIDAQVDFCPGGALPVPQGDETVPVLNMYIELFEDANLPVYATRDWHPEKTIHFMEYGGLWPPHCVQGSKGAEFHPELNLPDDAEVVSAGVGPNEEGYSSFEGRNEEGTDLDSSLRERGVGHLFIGGLATDYCVRATALDAMSRGFDVTVLEDAVKGIDVTPGDSQRAFEEMTAQGAEIADYEAVVEEITAQAVS
ncbi:MAG: nicotinamidase [Armatimonadota bacterium]|nr:nicotinamidase [Armatimonadota bacterium]